MGFAASSSFVTPLDSADRRLTACLAPLADWARRKLQHVVAPVAQTRPAMAVVRTAAAPATTMPARARPPLRVLRVVDGSPRQAAGRMVISGRMADVCAELDRLAARETERSARRAQAA